MQVVDLPGFRYYSTPETESLASDIEAMVMKYMRDLNNQIICVEEASDATKYMTLMKCGQEDVDPSYKGTVLVRNKLDKYYRDLNRDNVNRWCEGFGDLPDGL